LYFSNKKKIKQLPVVIVVPHLMPSKRLCDYYYDYPYSLLGLGDILIPGLSVNYAIIFDFSNSNKFPVYFIVNVIGTFYPINLIQYKIDVGTFYFAANFYPI